MARGRARIDTEASGGDATQAISLSVALTIDEGRRARVWLLPRQGPPTQTGEILALDL
jgi:hypothetical protein